MAQLTITEALAETKTIAKRLESKRQFVGQYLFRQDFLKDPLEKDGGSRAAIQRERQAIGDLEERVIAIRSAITEANRTTSLTVQGRTRTIQDWLTWRREVSEGQKTFLQKIRSAVDQARKQAQQQGIKMVAGQPATAPNDVIVNVDEQALAKEAEEMELVLGELDGLLSLKNATVLVTL